MLTDQTRNLKSCKKIGLFDSGIGGLSVLRKLTNLSYRFVSEQAEQKVNARQFIYLGDTARVPYGDRPASEIVGFVTEIIHWLVNQNVDGILIACNTSTALALETAGRESPVPVFDIIRPTAAHVANLGKKTGVLSTTSTSKSRAYSKAIASIDPNLEVLEIGCPDLVPLVENGMIFHKSAKDVLRPYVDRLLREEVKALVLGCTHFPFLAEPLKELLEDRITIIDPAEVLSGLLSEGDNSSMNNADLNAQHNIFVTGDRVQFEQAAALCLGHPLRTTRSVSIDELRIAGSTEKLNQRDLSQPPIHEKRPSTNLNPDNLVSVSLAGNS